MRIVRALVDEGEIPRARVQVITGKGGHRFRGNHQARA